MKKAAVLALAILLTPGSVLAATKLGPVEVSANVALVSNYVWRGISQSDRSPAIQGGIDANHDFGFYLGAWGSNVDFDDGDEANIELDIYGGWTKKWENGFGVDVGIIHYEYPGARSTLEYDFEEYYLGLSYSIMGVNLGAKYSYSPDFFGSLTGRDASYVDLKVDYTLPVGITLAGHYGLSFGETFNIPNGPDGYNDYSLSVSGEVVGLTLEAALYGTDKDAERYVPARSKWADDTLVLKVSKKF